jgi:hypothetical protein
MRFQHKDIYTYIRTYIHTYQARTHTHTHTHTHMHNGGKTHFLYINAGGIEATVLQRIIRQSWSKILKIYLSYKNTSHACCKGHLVNAVQSNCRCLL